MRSRIMVILFAAMAACACGSSGANEVAAASGRTTAARIAATQTPSTSASPSIESTSPDPSPRATPEDVRLCQSVNREFVFMRDGISADGLSKMAAGGGGFVPSALGVAATNLRLQAAETAATSTVLGEAPAQLTEVVGEVSWPSIGDQQALDVGYALVDLDLRCHAVQALPASKANASRLQKDMAWLTAGTSGSTETTKQLCTMMAAYSPSRANELKSALAPVTSTPEKERAVLAWAGVSALRSCTAQIPTAAALSRESS